MSLSVVSHRQSSRGRWSSWLSSCGSLSFPQEQKAWGQSLGKVREPTPNHDPTLTQPLATPQQPGCGSRDKNVTHTQHEVPISHAWLQKTNPSGFAPWWNSFSWWGTQRPLPCSSTQGWRGWAPSQGMKPAGDTAQPGWTLASPVLLRSHWKWQWSIKEGSQG